MKRVAVVIALAAGGLAAPLFAADRTASDPTCAEYSTMGPEDRMKSMEMMSGASGVDLSNGKTAPDKMTGGAMEACKAHPDGTVSEALKRVGTS